MATNSKAIASLIFGIINYVFLPVIGAIIAVVLGGQARTEISRNPEEGGNGLATAGIILGWITIVGVLALVVVGIIAGMWATAANA